MKALKELLQLIEKYLSMGIFPVIDMEIDKDGEEWVRLLELRQFAYTMLVYW